MDTIPKYSAVEFERRWLVNRKELDFLKLGAGRLIIDKYLTGTRLRLRQIVTSTGE